MVRIELGLEKVVLRVSLDKCCLIAVAGGTCAGKTTFSAELKKRLGNKVAEVIYMDDYFLDRFDPQLPRDEQGYVLFDAPGSYSPEFVNHIRLLTLGQNVWSPQYSIAENKRLSPFGRLVEARRVIIADGLFAISALKPHFPNLFAVYVEAEEEVRLQRRIVRDKMRFGMREEDIRRRWKEEVVPCHVRYVVSQKEQADLVITT